MKIIIDTNVLIRAVVGDDPLQSEIATETMERAEAIVVSVQTLCEFVWVLSRTYGISRNDIIAAIRQLRDTEKVVLDQAAVEAGLNVLGAGGDFADGVIAFEGNRLGGEAFVSFDKKAVNLLTAQGRTACLLTAPDPHG